MKRAGILRDAAGESRDLWIAIALALSFAIYHLLTTLTGRLLEREDPLYQVLSNGMMLWIFGLLWIAYRRWHEAGRNRGELHAIMRSITTEAIVLVDPQRRIRDCNDAVARLFGLSPDQLVGELTDILYGDRRGEKGPPSDIRRALDLYGFHVGRATGRHCSGREFPLEISTAVLKGRGGAVLVMRDISAQLEAEHHIVQAKEAAEQAYVQLRELEKLRDGLTHMVIHDMRTPLQVLMAEQELLSLDLGEKLPPDARDTLNGLIGQTKVLTHMTNAVLDVSRMESGQMPLKLVPDDLGLLVDEAISSLRGLARRHPVVREGLNSCPLLCDPEIVTRVVANLLVNAVKYTPPGGQITLRVTGTDGEARLEVEDTGPGIRPEDRQRVFDKYVQVGSKAGGGYHSAGLGLTFCKMAVEAHGGHIGVDEGAGGGACFWCTLPRSAGPA